MEKVLIIIAASGLCADSSHAGRQYHFGYDLKNMTEARSYCREKYTDLATIDNMEDMNILNSMVNLSKMADIKYKHRAWIGLYDDVDSWRWSLSNRTFYRRRQAEFRNWHTEEPNNKYSGEHCTEMHHTGLWNDKNCEARLMAVCLDITGSDVTFVLTDKNMTWTEAQKHCRTNYTDLASVRNMKENEMVKQLVPARQVVWIGLYRDSWKWLDGSNSSFRYWNKETREPNNNQLCETCVAADFSHSGQWQDWNCDFKQEFVCYSVTGVRKRVLKVKLLKKDSSRDLNDPAVMEDMLKQLKQRLKDQGVNPDNVKLSWRKQADGKVFHKHAWIGLYDDLDSWRWSLSDKGFYKQGETEFRRWAAGEPNNEDGSDVTFVLSNKTMTWTEAQNYCRTNYTDLASVRNMTENQKIQNLMGTKERVWIGFFRDSWKWSDGSNSSFRYWIKGEPNNMGNTEACVAANFDHSCLLTATTKRVIKLRVLKKTSGQDLNDPAVMEQMLEKLRQRLKDQGVNPDNVKLSWRKQADGKVFHKVEKKTKKKTKKTEL